MKNMVFNKRRPSVQEYMLQKSVTRGCAGTGTRPVFLCLQMKHHNLEFRHEKMAKQLYDFSFHLFWIVLLS